MANLDWPGRLRGPEEIVAAASPQNFTAAWVDMGSELYVQGAKTIALWINVDINNSTNARVRLLVKHASAGADEYLLPIRTVGATVVQVEDEYVEFNEDIDQKMVLSWELDGVVPYVQFQIQVGAVGAPTAAQVDTAYVTTGIG